MDCVGKLLPKKARANRTNVERGVSLKSSQDEEIRRTLIKRGKQIPAT